jgi:cytochrome c peroxidase
MIDRLILANCVLFDARGGFKSVRQFLGTALLAPLLLDAILFSPLLALAADNPEPISPIPLTVDQDAPRVALGAQLFNEVRLSKDGARSCTTCHPLDKGGADGFPRANSLVESKRLRNTPTVFNVRFNLFYNWDGAKDTLEAHNEGLLQNPAVMGSTWPDILAKLNSAKEYVAEFAAIYRDGITKANVVDALVHFERSLTTPNARFDRFLLGQRSALTADEIAGYQLFKSYGCVSCHQGMNVGGNLFQKFGVFPVDGTASSPQVESDHGRFMVTKEPRDEAVFRVPSLRNVALTAPYFHDGRAPSLEVAVQIMGKVQLGRELSLEDIRLIVAFLKTLTGEISMAPVSSAPGESK